MERQDISRVLLPPAIAPKPQPAGGGSYLSRAIVADRLKRYTIAERVKDQPLPLDLAPNRGLPSRHLSMSLVRSYRTFAPLPNRDRMGAIALGGIFLWHYPHDCSHWALPSKFGPSGARTFLRPCRRWGDSPATASPTFPSPSV